MRSLVFVALSTAILASACDSDDSAGGGTPQVDVPTVDAGSSGGGGAGDGGTGTPAPISPPAPGPNVGGLKVPYGYMLVTRARGTMPETIDTSLGYHWRKATMDDRTTLLPMERSLLYIEPAQQNQAVPGGLAVRIRRMADGVATNNWVCIAHRSGSSGRQYYVLVTGSNPDNFPDNESCNWYIFEAPDRAGPDRYHFMVRLDGVDYYLSGSESDAVTGYRVVMGAKVDWQLVGMDKEGGQLPP